MKSFLAACAAMMVAVGCGDSQADSQAEARDALEAESATLVRMEFTTSTDIPENPAPAIHVVVTDPAKVRAVFKATLDLHDVSPGTYNCPIDLGIRYQLKFSSDSAAPINVALNPMGCDWATIDQLPEALQLNDSYFASLAQALGIPEAKIYPVPFT